MNCISYFVFEIMNVVETKNEDYLGLIKNKDDAASV